MFLTRRRLDRRLAAAAVVIALLALAIEAAAIELTLTPARIEAALAVARGDAARRAAFHRPYLVPIVSILVRLRFDPRKYVRAGATR